MNFALEDPNWLQRYDAEFFDAYSLLVLNFVLSAEPTTAMEARNTRRVAATVN